MTVSQSKIFWKKLGNLVLASLMLNWIFWKHKTKKSHFEIKNSCNRTQLKSRTRKIWFILDVFIKIKLEKTSHTTTNHHNICKGKTFIILESNYKSSTFLQQGSIMITLENKTKMQSEKHTSGLSLIFGLGPVTKTQAPTTWLLFTSYMTTKHTYMARISIKLNQKVIET